MFIRRLCINKDGKSHFYFALVKSYRTARGPRQHIVAYLGDMKETTRLEFRQALQNHPESQAARFDDSTPDWVEVNVKGVKPERLRRFGDVWLALELLKKLKLDCFFREVLASRRPKIPWADLASILVVARFCEPKSELHIAEHLYSATALPDLLGIPAHAIYVNRLYRALDKMLVHKDALQRYLKERWGVLFAIEYDLILYDITSTYFEGQAASNPQAAYGYSRDHRRDCKQVLIALIVTKEGIPLGYEVFAGNRHDSTTVAAIIQKIEALYGKADRVWIMDRGMISIETLELLRQDGRRYIIGTPKSLLKKFDKELRSEGWQMVHDGLEVKRCPAHERTASDAIILCRSTARRNKEIAMRERFTKRIEAGLRQMEKNCESGRLKNAKVAERRLGRLLGDNRRAAKFFQIDVKEHCGTLHLRWSKHEQKLAWTNLSEGCYALRSNVSDWTPQQLWQAYIQLTDAEKAFRIHKDDLKLRPVWHQIDKRVNAHIFVCFLAYVLWKCFGQMCKHAGLGDEPRKIIQEIKKLHLVDIVLPTRNGSDLRLRCVTTPDTDTALLLQKLNLKPPSRLDVNLDL
jgi:transposase